MHFVFQCFDKPGAADVRAANRPAHIAYLDSHESRIVAAGPLLTEDGTGMIGSVLIVECDDRAAAEAFAAADPYTLAGLFERVEIRPWRKAYPKG